MTKLFKIALLCLVLVLHSLIVIADENLIIPNEKNTRYNPYPVNAPYNGLYSHAVKTQSSGEYLHISGQLGFNGDGSLPSSFLEQARCAIDNIQRTLVSAGMNLEHIVQMRFYLTQRDQIDDLVKVRIEKLNGLAPAVTTYVVGGLLDEAWLIEIEALAYVPSESGEE